MSAGLSAIEGLHPMCLVPETGLHGLGLAWSQTSWTGLSIKARGGANNIVVNRYILERSVWIHSCNRHSASSILICCFTISTS